MSTHHTLLPAVKMSADLSDFISRNMDNGTLGWPRLPRATSSKAQVHPKAARSCGLRVLVVGELTLELPIKVDATRAELADFLWGRGSGSPPPCTMRQLRVGGFVSNVVEVAAKLGAKVSVCTSVPVPTPV